MGRQILRVAVVGAETEASFADTFLELLSLMPSLRGLHLDFVGPRIPGHLHGVKAELPVVTGMPNGGRRCVCAAMQDVACMYATWHVM